MRYVIYLALSCFLSILISNPAFACKHKHVTKHKKHSTYRTMYVEGCCKLKTNCCGKKVWVCTPDVVAYRCKTEVYYHSGRNTARVEVCR